MTTPNPEASGEETPLDFTGMIPESVELPPTASFEPPQKPRWWERQKSNGKTSGPKLKGRKAPAPMPRGGLRKPLEDMYTSMGMMMMPFDPNCGKVIIESAERCAESLEDLAKTNPAVRRVLIALVTTNALGAVIMAHAPILMAIAMHHIPALKNRQEKMVADMAEMFANMPRPPQEETE